MPCISLAIKILLFLEAWTGPIKDNLLGPLLLNNNSQKCVNQELETTFIIHILFYFLVEEKEICEQPF